MLFIARYILVKNTSKSTHGNCWQLLTPSSIFDLHPGAFTYMVSLMLTCVFNGSIIFLVTLPTYLCPSDTNKFLL